MKDHSIGLILVAVLGLSAAGFVASYVGERVLTILAFLGAFYTYALLDYYTRPC